jgi:hypothetical protein
MGCLVLKKRKEGKKRSIFYKDNWKKGKDKESV